MKHNIIPTITRFSFFCFLFSVLAYANAFTYEEIEWVDLIPKEKLEIILNPPEELLQIEDGGSEDNMSALEEKGAENDALSRYYEALKSTQVIEAYNDKAIRIPGFVVPLVGTDDMTTTEFFIVPYFGACLHFPPPPPNQIIYGVWPEGVVLESLSDAMWFEGKLSIQTNTHDLGQSAYYLEIHSVEMYE